MLRYRGALVPTVYCFVALAVSTGVAQGHDFRGDQLIVVPVEPQQEAALPATAHEGAVQAVVDQYKLWEAGETLSVCFVGGEAALRAFFVDAAKDWDNAASIAFDFGAPPDFRDCNSAVPSHIRVSFDHSGSWSVVGTDAARISLSEPSLNIDLRSPFALASKEELRGTILHELGHALALQHEHQSPESGCDAQIVWDTVYAELAKPPNSWDRAKVDHNLRQLVVSPRLRTTAYDRKSIMHYSLPARWFKDGEGSPCWVARNDALSPTDVAAIGQAYPEKIEDQARYIAVLDSQSAKSLTGLDFTPAQLTAIQDAINRSISENLLNRGGQSNFIINGLIQSSTGKCSPPIKDVNGNVTITCNE
jgi:hypothetical protein